MHRTRIKICGIKDVDIALAATSAGADAIGLVFAEQSPRCVDEDQARAITKELPPFVDPVGLFVNWHQSHVADFADHANLRTVQLHGNETQLQIDDLSDVCGLSVVKAFTFDRQHLTQYRQTPGLSAILLDAPPKHGLTGGTGETFDWSELGRIDPNMGHPVILAGGLTPDNVGDAIRIVRPYAVDVSSGVESSRGIKDVGLIKAFCEAVREADAGLD